MVEFASGFRFGNDYNAVDSSTFGTVGRNGTHRIGGFALTLGNECGGTAAVAVNGVYTSESEHHFAHFIVGKTCGEGSVTSVYLAENERAVRFDTDHGTGSVGRSTFYRLGLEYTVLYEPAEVRGNSRYFSAVERSGHGAKLTVAVSVDSEISLRTLMYLGSTEYDAVHYHVAVRSVGVIRKSRIHRAYYVVAEAFIVRNRLGKLFSFPELRFVRNTVERKVIGIELVDAVITGQNFDVRVFGVYLEVVNHFTVITVCVVQHQFCFCCAGSKIVAVFGNYVKVIICYRRIKL